MKTKKVLFAATECNPFWATGGLGDVIGSLPCALRNLGVDVRVILPLYEYGIDKNNLQKIGVINVPVSWRNQYCGIFTLEKEGILYYFVENEYYFKRPTIYGQYDDGERFAYFSRAILEIIRFLDWKPDIIHCNDWQTALVPIYHKLIYKDLSGIKDVFTIHNIEYQGKFGKEILGDVFGIDYADYNVVDFDGCINLIKGAIETCDVLTTVSPTYASQLSDDFYAMGLSIIIKNNGHKLRGILNGIGEAYDPLTDKAVFASYGPYDMEGKAQNKRELQKLLNLPVTDAPLIAVISRLASHKGLDLIKYAIGDILKEDVQIVILGKGDRYYEEYFTYMQQTSPGKVCTVIAFNKDLAQKLYAGSDILLMPSKSEPCGLSQMIACRYGSVPVVRATGGLKDSIINYDQEGGNGFLFEKYATEDFLFAVKKAIELYHTPSWQEIRHNAMTSDFSWRKSAKAYNKLYNELI
ncbi:MAG: glycogen synthase [Clostridiales bacterium]|nr:glycogen synthase [Clostridiales bacterium]